MAVHSSDSDSDSDDDPAPPPQAPPSFLAEIAELEVLCKSHDATAATAQGGDVVAARAPAAVAVAVAEAQDTGQPTDQGATESPAPTSSQIRETVLEARGGDVVVEIELVCAGTTTASAAWDAGLVLAHYLSFAASKQSLCLADKRVMEIGAGTGWSLPSSAPRAAVAAPANGWTPPCSCDGCDRGHCTRLAVIRAPSTLCTRPRTAGFVGICAAILGADVTLTDCAQDLPKIEANIVLNKAALEDSPGTPAKVERQHPLSLTVRGRGGVGDAVVFWGRGTGRAHHLATRTSLRYAHCATRLVCRLVPDASTRMGRRIGGGSAGTGRALRLRAAWRLRL